MDNALLERKARAVLSLSELAKQIGAAGLATNHDFSLWKKDQGKNIIANTLWLSKESNQISAKDLIQVDLHKKLPLILMNYSKLAHNTLHAWPEGWTDPLRHCRGIVFNLRTGELIALPFPKFFNYREHPETTNLPNMPFVCPVKYDGHLGIIFFYAGKWRLTTRGYFNSPSSILGQAMLDEHAKNPFWAQNADANSTILVEIIAPETKVHINYHSQKKFVLIGLNNRLNLKELHPKLLPVAADLLGLGEPEFLPAKSITAVKHLMKDKKVRNQEGFVAFFNNGVRVKFKFETYLGLMFAAKLSYTNILKHLAAGNMEERISMMPEKSAERAREIIARIMATVNIEATPKKKWADLYKILPKNEDTDTARSYCRKFVKSLSAE